MDFGGALFGNTAGELLGEAIGPIASFLAGTGIGRRLLGRSTGDAGTAGTRGSSNYYGPSAADFAEAEARVTRWRERAESEGWAAARMQLNQVPASVWDLDVRERGLAIEEMFGQNTGNNFRAYDFWNPKTRTAVSYKSVDLNAETYTRNPGNINRMLRRELKDIQNFSSDALPNGRILNNSDITNRQMWIFVPPRTGKIYQRQLRVLSGFQARASQKGISSTVIIIP